MKISGLSCITKKIFLVFLGHPNQHHPLFTKELQHIMAWPLPFLQNLSHRDYGERRSIPARLLFAQGRVLEGATQKKV